MRKSTKTWLIIAAALILLGGILFVSVMTTLKWDFTKISTEKYRTEQHELTDAFHSISVNTDTADITLLPAEDGVARVVCFENEKLPHEVSVVDGVLTVNCVDNRHHWYDYITIFDFYTANITVYLPESAYAALMMKGSTGDVEIARGLRFESIAVEASTGDITCYASASGSIRLSASTGNVTLQGVSAGAASLSVTTGEIKANDLTVSGEMTLTVETGEAKLSNVTCLSLTSNGDTGDLTLDGMLVDKALWIKRSTGDIHMKDVNAGALALSTSTGDVIVSGATCVGDATVGVTTGKVYLTHVVCENVTTSGDTGNILLKDVIATQKLSIERSTGKVKLESVDAAEILIKTDTGDVTGSLLSEKVFIVNTDTGKIEVPNTVTGGRCEITTDTGDIEITIN